MSTLHAFGDSFVFGEIECSTALKRPEFNVTLEKNDFNKGSYDFVGEEHFSNKQDYEYFLKKTDEESFIRIFANNFNYDLINYSFTGSSNISQIYFLYDAAIKNKIKENDIVFFGFTSSGRDFESPEEYDITENVEFYHKNLIHYIHALQFLIYLENNFNLKIIKCNLFTDHFLNAYLFSNTQIEKDNVIKIKNNLKPKYYIGYNDLSNTTIDILVDNFGNNSIEKTIAYFNVFGLNEYEDHNNFDVRKFIMLTKDDDWKKYENYFQPRKHPTKSGHEKIASFFTNYIKTNFSDLFNEKTKRKNSEMFLYP